MSEIHLPYLSYSRISLYDDCPLKYKLKYIDGIEEKPNFFLFFGKVIHEVLQYFYSSPPKVPQIDELTNFYSNLWKEKQQQWEDITAEDLNLYFEYGKEMLKRFVEGEDKKVKKFVFPICVEHRFNIQINDVRITGVIDRVDRVNGDKIEIIDYKTAPGWGLERVRNDEQLMLYQIAAESEFPQEVKFLTIYHLPSSTNLRIEKHPKAKLENLKEKILEIAENIKSGRFYPKYDEVKCNYCSYKVYCPFFKEETLSEREKIIENKPIGEIVDELGKLNEQKKEIEQLIREYEELIIEYCTEKGVQRLSGTKYEILQSFYERWKILDKDGLTKFLTDLGEYEKILAIHDAKFQSYVNTCGKDIKEKLKRFIEIEVKPKIRIKKLAMD